MTSHKPKGFAVFDGSVGIIQQKRRQVHQSMNSPQQDYIGGESRVPSLPRNPSTFTADEWLERLRSKSPSKKLVGSDSSSSRDKSPSRSKLRLHNETVLDKVLQRAKNKAHDVTVLRMTESPTKNVVEQSPKGSDNHFKKTDRTSTKTLSRFDETKKRSGVKRSKSHNQRQKDSSESLTAFSKSDSKISFSHDPERRGLRRKRSKSTEHERPSPSEDHVEGTKKQQELKNESLGDEKIGANCSSRTISTCSSFSKPSFSRGAVSDEYTTPRLRNENGHNVKNSHQAAVNCQENGDNHPVEKVGANGILSNLKPSTSASNQSGKGERSRKESKRQLGDNIPAPPNRCLSNEEFDKLKDLLGLNKKMEGNGTPNKIIRSTRSNKGDEIRRSNSNEASASDSSIQPIRRKLGQDDMSVEVFQAIEDPEKKSDSTKRGSLNDATPSTYLSPLTGSPPPKADPEEKTDLMKRSEISKARYTGLQIASYAGKHLESSKQDSFCDSSNTERPSKDPQDERNNARLRYIINSPKVQSVVAASECGNSVESLAFTSVDYPQPFSGAENACHQHEAPVLPSVEGAEATTPNVNQPAPGESRVSSRLRNILQSNKTKAILAMNLTYEEKKCDPENFTDEEIKALKRKVKEWEMRAVEAENRRFKEVEELKVSAARELDEYREIIEKEITEEALQELEKLRSENELLAKDNEKMRRTVRARSFSKRDLPDTALSEEEKITRERLMDGAYHLPRYTWWQDLYQYLTNNHPLLGICFHNPLHPVGPWIRALSFVGSLCFGLATTNVVYFMFVLGNQNYNQSYFSTAVEKNVTGNADVNNYVEQNVMQVNVTSGMIALWTVGGALNAIYDSLIWTVATCSCCLPGGRFERAEGCRVYIVFAIVMSVVVGTTLTIMIQATMNETSQNQKMANFHGVQYSQSVEAYRFLVGFAVEIVVSLFVWYPIVGTIMFSGILSCGSLPIIGGRPYEIKQYEKEQEEEEDLESGRAFSKSSSFNLSGRSLQLDSTSLNESFNQSRVSFQLDRSKSDLSCDQSSRHLNRSKSSDHILSIGGSQRQLNRSKSSDHILRIGGSQRRLERTQSDTLFSKKGRNLKIDKGDLRNKKFSNSSRGF